MDLGSGRQVADFEFGSSGEVSGEWSSLGPSGSCSGTFSGQRD